MKDAPLHYKTVSQVASLIEAKELSPVELTGVMLARIDAVDGQYLSYATLMADQAMESARAAETAISAGNYLGPLHGVPVAVKDLCFTKGVRTMGGAKDRKSTRLNSSHVVISYAVFCLKNRI